MTPYILPFSSTEATLARAGGKGANLARLAQAAFAVPPGFIITTDAYRTFVAANQLQSRIVARATGISPDDPVALENTSTEIRALFEQASMPNEIAAEIRAAYRELFSHSSTIGLSNTTIVQLPVAVRSSATAEDLPGLAFAGQQDTYLNMVGERAVLDAVKRCWSSLWTARVIAYRAHNHISSDEVALAVVVQEMIASESSGVLFTANPVTGRRGEMVIDASFGLGEAIVSGQVDADHYVVNPHEWTITECKLGAKAIAIVPRVEGGTEQIASDGSQQQALPDAQIIELAHMAQRVADHFKAPQDIEWAWAAGQLYLLQSRPITSLYPLPENDRPGKGLRVYVNFNSIQGVTDPLTPLGIDALRLLFSGVIKLLRLHSSMRRILPDAGGRLFMDMTDPLRDSRLQNSVLTFLAQSDPGARQTLHRLIEAGRFEPRRTLTTRRALALLFALLPIVRRVLAAWIRPEQVRAHAIAMADQFIGKTQAHAQAAHDLKACLSAMERDLSQVDDISFTIMPTVLPVFGVIPILDRWLIAWLGEKPGAALQLMRGLPDNATTEMDLNLWKVAQTIRADPGALAGIRTPAIETLVDEYRQGKLPTTAQRPSTNSCTCTGCGPWLRSTWAGHAGAMIRGRFFKRC